MNKEHVDFFSKEIQDKLEVLPRAIEGKAPKTVLLKICRELQILKDAKEYFLHKT